MKLESEDEEREPPNSEDSDSEDEDSPMVDENGEPLSERITTSTAIKVYKGQYLLARHRIQNSSL